MPVTSRDSWRSVAPSAWRIFNVVPSRASAVRADSGHVELDGAALPAGQPLAVRDRGLSIVYQEFTLVPELDATDNIFLGREPRTRAGLIDFRRLNAAATAVLQRLDLPVAKS